MADSTEHNETPGDIALAFLKRLDADGTHHLFSLDPVTGVRAGRTFPPGEHSLISGWVNERAGRLNLYYTANEVAPDVQTVKPSKSDIVAIRALHVDVDPQDGKNLDEERARIADLLATKAPVGFNVVVDSGGGYQALAVLSEKMPVDDATREWAETYGRGLSQALGGDSTQNIDRLLRLPGTTNIPTPAKAAKGRVERAARVVKQSDKRVTVDDIEAKIMPSQRPASSADEDAAISAAILDVEHSGFDDISDYRELPADLRERFEADMSRDNRLAQLWHEGTIDRANPSGSDYRFKLAGLLKAQEGYTAENYAALAWVWGRANLQRYGREKVVRELGRDWGKAEPAARLMDTAEWFSPIDQDDAAVATVFDQLAKRDREATPGRVEVIAPTPFVLRAPSAIPPRQWLYGDHIISGFQSLTVAPGGLGKSSLMTVEMLAMVTGKPLLGDAPPEPLRVWSWNGEDPQDELDRRLTAACLHFGITAADIGDRLMVDSGRSLPIKLATMGNAGVQVATPLVAGLVNALRAARIDVLVIDPFVTTHEVSENDTAAVNTVAALWRKVANEAGCAVELVHHMNKAAALDTDAAGIYGSRGAVALIDASRSARYLSRLKKDEADRLGLDDHSRFFRVENGKANMAPMGSAVWRQMIGVPLHNGAGHWPKGDVVGVCTAWTPPEALDGITNADVAAVVEAIRSRPEPPRWEEKADDWIGFLIAEILHLDVGKGLTKAQRSAGQNTARAKVRGLQQEWRQQGVLATATWRDTRKGKDVKVATVGAGPIGADNGVFG